MRDVDKQRNSTWKKGLLLQEIEKILEEHPSYRMLGPSFVCPTCVVDKICEDARFIQSVDDLDIPGLRHELRARFFNVVKNCV